MCIGYKPKHSNVKTHTRYQLLSKHFNVNQRASVITKLEAVL